MKERVYEKRGRDTSGGKVSEFFSEQPNLLFHIDSVAESLNIPVEQIRYHIYQINQNLLSDRKDSLIYNITGFGQYFWSPVFDPGQHLIISRQEEIASRLKDKDPKILELCKKACEVTATENSASLKSFLTANEYSLNMALAEAYPESLNFLEFLDEEYPEFAIERDNYKGQFQSLSDTRFSRLRDKLKKLNPQIRIDRHNFPNALLVVS
jgi:hypothetical protein